MRKLHTRRGGFTLIELMIVVAIIGILAAIAIPNFLKFQLRSKTGEAKTNLAALRTAEEGYFAEYGVYITAADYPGAATVTSAKQEWVAPVAGFDTVGWGPEGEVYYSYIATNTVGTGIYSLGAIGDLDGSGVAAGSSDFGYIHPATSGGATIVPGNNSCAATGVYNATSGGQDLLDTVGPCDALDGQADF
jgi:type IV pilus assembly protein PilA